MKEIKKVCVLGAGLMGNGIAQVCAQAGMEVTMRDIEQRFIDSGMKAITKNINRDVEKGKKTKAEADAILARIKPVLDLTEAAKDADVIVEVIIEVMDVKKKLYKELDEIVSADCLYFTNTSGLSITEMAAITNRPEKVIGTHFFNPVPVMRLLEVIRAYQTSDETLASRIGLGEETGQGMHYRQGSPGFCREPHSLHDDQRSLLCFGGRCGDCRRH